MSAPGSGSTNAALTDDQGGELGYSFKRLDSRGRVRYTACYKDIRGNVVSAGTYSSKRAADKAWQQAEARMDQGKIGHPSRGKQTFAEYVKNTWLPNHQVEPSTMQSYTYTLNRHILPTFGPMRMVDILPEHVRAWIAKLKDDGVKAPTIKYAKVLLSVIFTTALNDQVTYIHPGRGVRTPTVAVKPRTVITPEQFDVLYQALPDSDTQLLVETAIETGLRWGELSELRVKDLNTRTRILTVSRAVVEVNPKFHPDGGRFIVKEYPKDKEFRRFKLSRQMVDKLEEHIRSEGLERDDLFFTWKHVPRARLRTKALPDVDTLGWTKPNENGKTYKHGTLSAYNAGKCRCEHCRAAFAQYRAKRRGEEGKDTPRQPRQRDTDGHIPADWFRRQVWKPALKEADLGIHVRIHDMRHAHASWLLAGGADLQVVKERLGHASIATTEKYLHTLDDADETALEAFSKIRNRCAR
ncbi:tyrosine-type recombinase/integrase family protein [Microbispora sp. RL4-1S]|uniref:Tyrosine-type recombinase/integrase family protein n=1 Tax=Microbispora oryzae TaxID=2806554 RepID=A0A940WQH0_9ACTN|nr:tyrosine-type recombinase/integrase [Microbispora oryzae]MBP2707403.1 tyrosine-type recombinase/integrase family protein [Microbispora oryzae]